MTRAQLPTRSEWEKFHTQRTVFFQTEHKGVKFALETDYLGNLRAYRTEPDGTFRDIYNGRIFDDATDALWYAMTGKPENYPELNPIQHVTRLGMVQEQLRPGFISQIREPGYVSPITGVLTQPELEVVDQIKQTAVPWETLSVSVSRPHGHTAYTVYFRNREMFIGTNPNEVTAFFYTFSDALPIGGRAYAKWYAEINAAE